MPPENPPAPLEFATPSASTSREHAHAQSEPDNEKLLNRAVYPSTKYESPPTWAQSIAGWAYVSWIMLGPFLDMVWVIIPTRFFIRSSMLAGKEAVWPQKLLKWLEETYYSMLGGLLEIAGGMKFVITTDDKESAAGLTFPEQDQVLLLCNHRTEIDWIFFWNLSMRFNCHGRIRVMMKSIIRCLPGPGWAMLMLDYPYISRKWDTDQDRIKNQIATYKAAAVGFWLCMFPEGTALYRRTLERSQEFAKSRNEPTWSYVLSPRIRGFELCVQEQDPDAVLDVTVGYPELAEGVRPSPLRLVRGQFPRAVHVHLTKYSKKELAPHKDSMEQWLKQRFQEKEDRLRTFYETGSFGGCTVTTSQVNIPIAVWKGVVFHAFLTGWTFFSWVIFPIPTFLWFSFCMALVLHHIYAFDKQ
ncbi:hypothetical protein Poli38472_009321 [Pythium oligandrum]|uniref:Phospholipid/glycerol acyltransferase domain-containing protein n=1 Tax=Pythium oligandrum TaxID=41045 RepID=A0A8K1CKE3_PYTOL|nr:hypothetical protein Poli38472_009321 [Pythium oligandrum]|eukprot:TMW65154.1 hypothetical protein Poli38472_009321 [Pythium oligandrum]